MKEVLRKIMNWRPILQFRKNTLTQITVFSVIMIVSALLYNVNDFFIYTMVGSCIVLSIYVVVFVIAGIINMIKDLIKKIKK